LNDQDIARMLQAGFATAQEDMVARALAEARLDADRICLATRSALQVDGHWLDMGYRASIEKAIDDLIAAKTATDPSVIEACTKALSDATESFAAQRMNRGIQQALAGKNIESL